MKLKWEIKVPIFKNRFILKGLGLAIGIPFGLLIIMIVLTTKGDIEDARYALYLIGLLFLLTFLFVMLVYGGKYAPGYIVDEEGVTNYTQKKQAKKNKIINTIVFVLGIFKGNFTAAGAGAISQSRQVMQIKWKNITKVRYYPKQHTIIIKGGFSEKIAVFCTVENYDTVTELINKNQTLLQ